jgi:hypothetical protein
MFLIQEYGPAGVSVLGLSDSLVAPLADQLRTAHRIGFLVAEELRTGAHYRVHLGVWVPDRDWPRLSTRAA